MARLACTSHSHARAEPGSKGKNPCKIFTKTNKNLCGKRVGANYYKQNQLNVM